MHEGAVAPPGGFRGSARVFVGTEFLKISDVAMVRHLKIDNYQGRNCVGKDLQLRSRNCPEI